MRNGMRLRVVSICGWALAALVAWAPSGKVSAQSSDTEYCYASQCYSSLGAAEAAMDAAHPEYSGLFEPKDSTVGSGGGGLRSLSITYVVPDQPATVMEPFAFSASGTPNPAPTMCTPSENARYPTMCVSESDSSQASLPV